MALREEFEKSGNWLFRWRSYLPLFLIVIIITSLLTKKYMQNILAISTAWKMICLFISFIGLGIRIVTIGYTPSGTSGRNTKKQIADSLNTSGIYSQVRHPLYLGNFFIWLGFSLFFKIWWISLIFVLLFWIYYERIMFAEEEFLRKKFNKQYTAWAKKTPAFFPKLKNWQSSSFGFSFKNILKREYIGFFGITVIFTLLELMYNYYNYSGIAIDRIWSIIFISGFIVFIIIRILAKKTGMLNEKGR